MYAASKQRRQRNFKSSVVTSVSAKGSTPTSGTNPSKRHRERLNGELDSLASFLPYAQSVLAKLDKLSILRLSVAFVQVKTHFRVCSQKQYGYNTNCYAEYLADFDEEALKALGGFLLIASDNGDIFFASENIEKFLGFHQSDILHQPIYDLIHSEDRALFRDHLVATCSLQDLYRTELAPVLERKFTARFRCLLDNTCGFLRLEIVGHLTPLQGLSLPYPTVRTDTTACGNSCGLVALCVPLVSPLHVEPADSTTHCLRSKHNLAFAITSAEARFRELLNIGDGDFPVPYYRFIDDRDLEYFTRAHAEINGGASGALVYRVYPQRSNVFARWHTSKVLWLQTSIRTTYKNGKADSIQGTHRVLTEAEGLRLLANRTSLMATSFCLDEHLHTVKMTAGNTTTKLPTESNGNQKAKGAGSKRHRSPFRDCPKSHTRQSTAAVTSFASNSPASIGYLTPSGGSTAVQYLDTDAYYPQQLTLQQPNPLPVWSCQSSAQFSLKYSVPYVSIAESAPVTPGYMLDVFYSQPSSSRYALEDVHIKRDMQSFQRYCFTDSCKAPYEPIYNCLCLPQYICTARSGAEDAFCQISHLGYSWLQPPMLGRLYNIFGRSQVDRLSEEDKYRLDDFYEIVPI